MISADAITRNLAVVRDRISDAARRSGRSAEAVCLVAVTKTVGVEAARNRQAAQGYEDTLIQLQNMRDGVDGVSIEDEMINLLQYQRAFEASAKFLSTVDEMMGTLLTLKR